MKKIRKSHVTFPSYLKDGLTTPALRWLGKKLEDARNKEKKTMRMIAEAGKVTLEQIREIETGVFKLNTGLLRNIIFNGYKVVFNDLLAECYEANRAYFDPSSEHVFDRDFHYSLCREGGGDRFKTAFLIGGDPKRYLWAIPMRRLKESPLATELLELAPFRERKPAGETPDNSHRGIEVVHVIHGAISVRITTDTPPITRPYKAGDSIHFHSKYVHRIKNTGPTSALLLVVRLSELSGS